MSDSQSFEQLSALWTRVFGQPPPIKASAAELARLLVQHLPPIRPYQPGQPPASAGQGGSPHCEDSKD